MAVAPARGRRPARSCRAPWPCRPRAEPVERGRCERRRRAVLSGVKDSECALLSSLQLSTCAFRGSSGTGRFASLSSCVLCRYSQDMGCARAWCSGAPRLVSRRRYCSAAARQQEAMVPGTSVSPTRTAGPQGASARRDVTSRTRTVRLRSSTQQALACLATFSIQSHKKPINCLHVDIHGQGGAEHLAGPWSRTLMSKAVPIATHKYTS